MNIYRGLAVREIKKKKKHLEFMNQDPSINNRPVADGVLPSPTTFLQVQFQPCPSLPELPHTHTRVHTHTDTHARMHTAWLWLHKFPSSSAVSHTHSEYTDMCLHLPVAWPTASLPHTEMHMQNQLQHVQAASYATFRQMQPLGLGPAHTAQSHAISHVCGPRAWAHSLTHDFALGLAFLICICVRGTLIGYLCRILTNQYQVPVCKILL